MKIVLLIGDQKNQRALASKIADRFNVTGIVFEKRTKAPVRGFKNFIRKIADRILFSKIRKSWNDLQNFYSHSWEILKDIPNITTSNINNYETQKFISKHKPDLIFVSGTSLLKNEILNLKPVKGILNLHTGLSPYVRGGPNCTNWCIANNTVHLIGNTVMWIDAGIDSGNILTSETTLINGDESLAELQIKVMEHAHELTLRALNKIETDFSNCPSVNQKEIATGQLFLSRMWDFKSKLRFIRNVSGRTLKKSVSDPLYSEKKSKLITVSLEEIKK